MHDHNPALSTGASGVPPASDAPGGPDAAPAPPSDATPEPDDARWGPTRRGLAAWFVVLATAGVGGLLFRHDELAALAALAGLYVAAQAADLDRQWTMLHEMLAWVVPAGGVAVFLTLAFMLDSTPLAAPWGALLIGTCIGGALASGLTLFRPFANALAAAMFRTPTPSRTLRLTARLVFITILFSIPGWFAIRNVFDSIMGQLDSLIESASLGTGLLGYLMLAFASVGFMLRRGWRETFDRLGIGPITPSHVLVIALGVVALVTLNSGADWLQKTFFHDLWLEDQRVSAAIAGHLTLTGTIMLGLSAGIGEEVTMRGALQPRLGLAATALVFASLHIQYSWFGVAMIFLFGLLLGLLRSRTNTSVAMAVHALYDMVAVFSIPRAE